MIEDICYHNKKKIGITFVKINPGFQTSLHCHPQKKTGFVILSGSADVQIGLYEKNVINYKPLSILVLAFKNGGSHYTGNRFIFIYGR